MESREDTLDRLLELTVLLGQDMAEGVAGMGLTASRAHLVWELQQRGPCTQRVLADALKVAPRTITTLLDGLVSTGFVTREPHPSDRRASLVTFTPHGRATAQKLVEDHRRLAQALFGDLRSDVLDAFDLGLDHVLERLRTLVTQASASAATDEHARA